jgi:hypothetical protein
MSRAPLMMVICLSWMLTLAAGCGSRTVEPPDAAPADAGPDGPAATPDRGVDPRPDTAPIPDLPPDAPPPAPDLSHDLWWPDLPWPDLPWPDLPWPKPDLLKPDLPQPISTLGEGCLASTSCKGPGEVCIQSPSHPQIRVCSRKCTADDLNTPLINEDDCPKGFLCAAFKYTSATYYCCLQKCTPSLTANPCPASSKTTCHPLSTRWGTLSQAVCFEPACAGGKDCPVLSAKTCTTDADCTSAGSGSFCEPTQKLCALPGACSPGGVCAPHTHGKAGAKVGDPCTSDLDCPNGGSCQRETSGGSGTIGISYHNGYCTVPYCAFSASLGAYACPAGSDCFRLFYGGRCMMSCSMSDPKGCRGLASDKGGDYECYGWHNLSISGTVLAKGPVCTDAAGQTCDSLGSFLDCSALGADKTNSTNMQCRDRFSGKAKTNKHDPTGVCLDDTASGTF